MRLNDRITKLEASLAIPRSRAHFHPLRAVATADVDDIGFALEDGFWPNLSERPEIAVLLECDELSAEQGAVMGAAAREVMANEQPKGAPWGGEWRAP